MPRSRVRRGHVGGQFGGDPGRGDPAPEFVHDPPMRKRKRRPPSSFESSAVDNSTAIGHGVAPVLGFDAESRHGGLEKDVPAGMVDQPLDEIAPGLPDHRVDAAQGKEIAPGLVGDGIHRQTLAPQPLEPFAEKETSPAKIRPALGDDQVHQAGAAAADEIVDHVTGNALGTVAFLAEPRTPAARAQSFDPVAGDALWWAVGVGVHPVGSGEDPLEVGDAVFEGLSGLVRDAVDRIDVAEANFFGGGEGVLLGPPDHDQPVLRCAARRLAEGLQRRVGGLAWGHSSESRRMGGWSRAAMTRTRPRSSSAKIRSGWVGQPRVPARPLSRTARTQNGPAPRSNSGRRSSPSRKSSQESASGSRDRTRRRCR